MNSTESMRGIRASKYRVNLQDSGPEHLFVSGCRAPHIPKTNASTLISLAKSSSRNSNNSKEPERSLGNRQLMKLFMGVLRADFEMVETCRTILLHRCPASSKMDTGPWKATLHGASKLLPVAKSPSLMAAANSSSHLLSRFRKCLPHQCHEPRPSHRNVLTSRNATPPQKTKKPAEEFLSSAGIPDSSTSDCGPTRRLSLGHHPVRPAIGHISDWDSTAT
jgi:hypothetical protein